MRAMRLRTEATDEGIEPLGVATVPKELGRSWEPKIGARARPASVGAAVADLSGKTALVTGGSRGLGFVVAHELVAAGMRAVAICARDEAGLERARTELARAGARVLAVRSDVTDRRQVEALVEAVVAGLGRLDVLVHGVGALPSGAGDAKALTDSDEIIGPSFWAPLFVTLAARPVMRSQGGGRIVNIGTRGRGRGSAPERERGASTAPDGSGSGSVLALLQFSRALRAELARDGIVMTTVYPRVAHPGPSRRSGGAMHRDGDVPSAPHRAGPASGDSFAAQQIVRACGNGQSDVPLPSTDQSAPSA